ncbi:SpaA isopeptide-forming pilin-related protein [Enterococcus gallinarum]|uniref:SpaA isopeptide-forming pilin-related protein n=1 Tax=Enterococcus gallinarum TaxID=1353 RepID=A0AAE4KWZ4_ENTGA|nr:SpaA isopeptide-forming pilin-related protein [Enterococcus gallinarum]MDT2691519.1 SpaA isopeptide-forming pilin-related protein [Enterococcus gallinarum]
MSKVKKLMTTLMLFLTLSGTIVEPVSVLAETMNTVETQEVQEDTTATEAVESSTEEAETSTTSSDQSTNTKTDQQEKIGESQNANDSPTSETVEEMTQSSTEEADQSVYDYLREQGYEMLEDGTIVSTNGTTYRDDYLSVIQEVKNMLNPNRISFRMARAAGQSVYVNRDYGSSTIGWTYSNGISELGWYAKKDANGGMLWCIEPGVPLNWGQNYPYTTSEVSQDKYIRASLAVYYGWEKQKSVINAFYTERLVQEITTGVTTSGIYDYNGVASQSGYNTFRKNILAEVETFFTLPSFAGKTYNVKLGETLTLTDSTGNLSKYKVTADTANVTVSQSGNTLKITPKSDSKESGRLTLRYQIAAEYEGATILYSAPYLQDVMKARIGDPRFFSVNLNVELQGQGEIIKVDENGKGLAGAQFEIKNKTTNKTETKTTDKDGKISGKWDSGTVLEIQEVKAPSGYVLNTVKKTLTIEANKTKSVTFTNKAQVGTITIDKSAAETGKDMPNSNYSLKGNEFTVYKGEKAEGTAVGTITTDESGIGRLTGLPLGKYSFKERKASNGFILNTKTWTVELTYAGQNVEITTVSQAVTNQEQKGSVVLTKQDSTTGSTPQGDTTFAGAEFDLFRKSDNKKLGHYTTNDKGQLTVNNLLIDAYYFVETKAPVGYVLDKTPVEFSIAYAGQTANVAKQASVMKKNTVVTGGFDLIKTGNYNWYTTAWNWLTGKDTSDQPTVLEGVEFTVKQDFGNKEVVGKALTDKQGYVSFNNLPYGTYIVSETKTPTGFKGIADFKVTISEDGQRFHYVVENKVKEAKVKFVKVDSETGKTIVRSNAGFEIYSKTTGEQLVMQDLQGKEQSVFYTDEEGVLQLPTQFAFGKYYAKEVKAPEGYVLAKNTIDFEVNGDEKDGLVVVTIKNDNQKGQLTLHKTVQTAMSVAEKESEYGSYSEIQFDQGNGEGFSFKIRPTEDIITADGTIRFTAGEFLQKDGEDRVWTTDSEGNFQTEAFLYGGKYELVEVKAPAGVNLEDTKPIPFEITYAGQNVDITSTSATAENNLQIINIYGHKKQEVITGWEDGKAIVELEDAKNGQVFALRTGQDLQIGNTTIKAGTTVGYAEVKDGVISFEKMLLPNVQADYYLQEVNAGSDHVLNEAQYHFTYTPATNDREHEIHVWADSFAENKQAMTRIVRNPIVNELARATVKLVKTDDLDGQPLENVAFDLVRIDSIKNENGEESTTETVISKHATNAAGEIVVENLPTGNYKFVESRPLDWYQDNTDDLTFTITPKEDGTVIELSAVNFRKPLEITTKFATTKDGHKQANPDIDNELTDYVSVDGMKPGHTYFVDTAYVNRDTEEVVSTSTSEITTDKEGTFEFTTELSLPKGTLKDSTRLTATHVIYEDKDKTKEIGRHDDLENDEQTVTFKSPKVSIRTKAHTGDNKTQTFTHGDIINAYDNVDLSHENVLDGTERAFEAILVAQTPDGKMTDIWTSGKINYVVNDSTIVKQVKTQVDTSKYPEGTTFFFKEVGYNESGEKDCEHNFDGKDKQQALTPVKKGTLPKTGSTTSIYLMVAGAVLLLVVALGFFFLRKKQMNK